MIYMLVNYGRLRKDRGYHVQEVGRDWVRIHGIYVPRSFTHTVPASFYWPIDEEEYGDVYE